MQQDERQTIAVSLEVKFHVDGLHVWLVGGGRVACFNGFKRQWPARELPVLPPSFRANRIFRLPKSDRAQPLQLRGSLGTLVKFDAPASCQSNGRLNEFSRAVTAATLGAETTLWQETRGRLAQSVSVRQTNTTG